MKDLVLSGKSLTIDDLHDFVSSEEAKVTVSKEALRVVERTREFLEHEIEKKIIYGVNTGFGPMSTYIISPSQANELQINLIRSHASGVGDYIPDRYALSAMVVRLNTLLRGYSAVSSECVEALKDLINARIIPCIPEHGAVGTSGDLLQLAHIGLALIGEGTVSYKGTRMSAADACADAGLTPYVLKPKEGLSLINGTSAMAGIMALAVKDAELIFSLATRSSAFGLEMVSAFTDGFSTELSEARVHEGQLTIAKTLQKLTKGSKRIRERYETFKPISDIAKAGTTVDIRAYVQEVYSLRCVPQILGPLLETVQRVRRVVEIEINATTDNPIVTLERHVILHGGNFHGEYIAQSADQLKATLAKLSILLERRVNFFLSSHINRYLPPFLNRGILGLNLGLQALQFVATSTTAQNQSLAYPHSIHSISTNADNQDVVSMGTDASLMCMRVLENTKVVLAVELTTIAQAVDCLKCNSQLSKEATRLYTFVRAETPELIEDRPLSDEVTRLSLKTTDAKELYLDDLFDAR